jgi:uncharacterized protein
VKDVIAAWTGGLREVLGAAPLAVADVRVGVFYTAVRLDSGHVGVAYTPRGLADTVCCPRSAAQAPAAGRLAGRPAWALVEEARAPAPLRRSVGVAVLNALSNAAVDRHGTPGAQAVPGADALEAAGVRPDDRVVLVGAFVPFIKTLKRQVADLVVVDAHRDALKPDEAALWRAPAAAAAALSRATVAVITGAALVEGGLDGLLDAAAGARQVVLAGPTAPLWPPPFFDRGVTVLGGIRVRDGEALLRVVGEGGSGYFFNDIAEKICVLRSRDRTTIAR